MSVLFPLLSRPTTMILHCRLLHPRASAIILKRPISGLVEGLAPRHEG